MFVDLPGNGVLKKMNFHVEGVNLSHDWFDIERNYMYYSSHNSTSQFLQHEAA